jgi:RimJ/RimL family protein N-acetyltransferase
MPEIQTERLRLIALTSNQLELYRDAPHQLERELGVSIPRDDVSAPLHRAIDMKVRKMAHAAEADHPWYTYWLIVIAAQSTGAGMAGFKGVPNARGEVEIGYGIDPAHRNRGYTTEAARGLIDWAFQAPRCRSVVAPDTLKANVASNRVLEKLGMHVYGETDDARHWRLDRPDEGPV